MLANVDTSPSLGDLTPEDLRELAVRLRRARRDAGLSQAALASELGLGQSTISRLELGEASIRRWQLEAIAKRLGVALDWLAFGTGEVARPTARSLEPGVPAQSSPSFVRQYLVCPVCGQDALTPDAVIPHLMSDRCERPHTLAEAEELAPKATIDPQPWAYVLARYERQLEAAREAARFRLRGRTHWRRLVRVVRKARDRMLESGPDAFLIRTPRLDDPYWIPSDLESPEWPSAIRGSMSDAELDEIERESDRG